MTSTPPIMELFSCVSVSSHLYSGSILQMPSYTSWHSTTRFMQHNNRQQKKLINSNYLWYESSVSPFPFVLCGGCYKTKHNIIYVQCHFTFRQPYHIKHLFEIHQPYHYVRSSMEHRWICKYVIKCGAGKHPVLTIQNLIPIPHTSQREEKERRKYCKVESILR
jgi:hypothetical protein